MHPKVAAAYTSLVPADQLVVDAVISSIAIKARQAHELAGELHKMLLEKQEVAE